MSDTSIYKFGDYVKVIDTSAFHFGMIGRVVDCVQDTTFTCENANTTNTSTFTSITGIGGTYAPSSTGYLLSYDNYYTIQFKKDGLTYYKGYRELQIKKINAIDYMKDRSELDDQDAEALK